MSQYFSIKKTNKPKIEKNPFEQNVNYRRYILWNENRFLTTNAIGKSILKDFVIT